MELEKICGNGKEMPFNERTEEEHKKIRQKGNLKRHLKSNIVLISIIISTIIGFSVGIYLKYSYMKNSEVSAWLVLPGKLFLRSLRLFIIPVIFFGVLNATSSLNTSSNTKLTFVCFAFVFASHLIACLIGIAGSFIFSTFRTNSNQTFIAATQRDLNTQKTVYDIFVDILNNLIPKNIFKATMYQEFTKYELVNSTDNSSLIERKRITMDVPDTNVLGILTFAIIIGMATGSIGEKGQSFRTLIQSINHVVMKVLRWIILFGPIGFSSLIIDAVLNINDLEKNLKELGIFIAVVSACCFFYGIIVLSTACFMFTRKNPFKYYLNFFDPILLAFASTSSGVCIHRSIETCENKLRLNPIVTRFSFPFYTALQADGSAMFITMSTIFLAYFNNITLAFSDYLIILIMASVLCLSLPCVPSSSLLTILVVLASINLNVNIAPLYACEWILDRIRTAVNVYSHCVCTVMTNELFKNDKKFFNLNGEIVKFSNGCVSTDNCVNSNKKSGNEDAQEQEFIEKL